MSARILRRVGVFSFLALLSCEGGGPPPSSGEEETPVGRRGEVGRLVVIGGALRSENTPVYQAILDSRWGDGPLCVLPTASGTPASAMDGYVQAFDSLGGPGTARGIPLTVDNRALALEEEIADRLRECSGFFFTGGVQSRILEVFLPDGEPTPAYHALWERFRAGAVISGSSAGAAIISDPMIGGGSSGNALRQGVQGMEDGGGVRVVPGLGFMGEGIVDQHFLARGRWARLLVAVLATDEDRLGFGIDENTALVVAGDSAWVLGESAVVFLDARSAVREDGGNGGYGVRMYLLGAGDGVDLRAGAVSWERSKTSIPPGARPVSEPPEDLFAPWSLLTLLFDLATASDDRLTFHQDGHFLELRKEPGFRAMGWDGVGIQGTPRGLFLGPFVLSAWRE
ncbi:MAG: cyanophycinase [Longimicrobiales bacterium]